MTQEEYDEHLKGRSDYIKATKKDSSNEKIVSTVKEWGLGRKKCIKTIKDKREK